MAKVFPLEFSLVDKSLQNIYDEALFLCKDVMCTAPISLIFADDKVGVQNLSEKNQKPVYVDFIEGTLAHRRKYGGGRKSEAVAKACFGNMPAPIIFDATAGLARDSFVCAYLGAEVHMFERNPVVRILLKDGIRRAKEGCEDPNFYTEKLILEDVISIDKYKGNVEPDTVYLDPMYPERKKSALVKKEMRTFHFLIGEDLDSEALLQSALILAKKRVVMKKPKWAEVVAPENCIANIETQNHRFDIYLLTAKL